MFGSKKNGVPQNSIDSLIGSGTRVEGNIVFSGGLRVDGEVKGNISSSDALNGTVVISEKATLEGTISVGHVVVNGTVIGPISAAGSLELLPSARVLGDVEYQQIEMQQGSVIEGRMVHKGGTKAIEFKPATSGNDEVA